MKLNQEQTNYITEFIVKYNSDLKFQEMMQDLYDNDICELTILQIYALEEILRYGVKGVFDKFNQAKGNTSDEQAVKLFDSLIKLLLDNEQFREYKMEQLELNPEMISEMEILAFNLIQYKFAQEKVDESIEEEVEETLEYDEYIKILYSTDSEIRATLGNLFFGQFILEMLDRPGMQAIKDRQKERGLIANSDKEFILSKIEEIINNENALMQYKKVIDSRYTKVKMNILLGNAETAFDEFIQYRTNIDVVGTFDLENTKDFNEFMDYVQELIKKRKDGENPKRPF